MKREGAINTVCILVRNIAFSDRPFLNPGRICGGTDIVVSSTLTATSGFHVDFSALAKQLREGLQVCSVLKKRDCLFAATGMRPPVNKLIMAVTESDCIRVFLYVLSQNSTRIAPFFH